MDWWRSWSGTGSEGDGTPTPPGTSTPPTPSGSTPTSNPGTPTNSSQSPFSQSLGAGRSGVRTSHVGGSPGAPTPPKRKPKSPAVGIGRQGFTFKAAAGSGFPNAGSSGAPFPGMKPKQPFFEPSQGFPGASGPGKLVPAPEPAKFVYKDTVINDNVFIQLEVSTSLESCVCGVTVDIDLCARMARSIKQVSRTLWTKARLAVASMVWSTGTWNGHSYGHHSCSYRVKHLETKTMMAMKVSALCLCL